jgi:hypothetical protein
VQCWISSEGDIWLQLADIIGSTTNTSATCGWSASAGGLSAFMLVPFLAGWLYRIAVVY